MCYIQYFSILLALWQDTTVMIILLKFVFIKFSSKMKSSDSHIAKE